MDGQPVESFLEWLINEYVICAERPRANVTDLVGKNARFERGGTIESFPRKIRVFTSACQTSEVNIVFEAKGDNSTFPIWIAPYNRSTV
jgi:hypothetical protein